MARRKLNMRVGELDLGVELRRLWRLEVVREARVQGKQSPRKALPKLIVRRHTSSAFTSAYAFSGGPIVLTLAEDGELEAALTLLHEVIHAALPDAVGHGPMFWSYLSRAAVQAWPGAFPSGKSGMPVRGPGWLKNKFIKDRIREWKGI